jgi:hypothetical protein
MKKKVDSNGNGNQQHLFLLSFLFVSLRFIESMPPRRRRQHQRRRRQQYPETRRDAEQVARALMNIFDGPLDSSDQELTESDIELLLEAWSLDDDDESSDGSSDDSVPEDLPPRVDRSQWTRSQYNGLREQLENEIRSTGNRPVSFTRFPSDGQAVEKKIHGPLLEALNNHKNMVIITQYNACRLFCDHYKSRNPMANFNADYIKAFVLWTDSYYKPVFALEDGTIRTNIQVWYNKLSDKDPQQQECVVCYNPFAYTSDESQGAPDYRWCGTCGEKTCLTCYTQIKAIKTYVRCPHCRTHFDVATILK